MTPLTAAFSGHDNLMASEGGGGAFINSDDGAEDFSPVNINRHERITHHFKIQNLMKTKNRYKSKD